MGAWQRYNHLPVLLSCLHASGTETSELPSGPEMPLALVDEKAGGCTVWVSKPRELRGTYHMTWAGGQRRKLEITQGEMLG